MTARLICKCPICGCGAFMYCGSRKPESGTVISSVDFEHLDGTAITPRSRVTCDTCGTVLRFIGWHTAFVDGPILLADPSDPKEQTKMARKVEKYLLDRGYDYNYGNVRKMMMDNWNDPSLPNQHKHKLGYIK